MRELIRIRSPLIIQNWKATRDYLPQLTRIPPQEAKSHPLIKKVQEEQRNREIEFQAAEENYMKSNNINWQQYLASLKHYASKNDEILKLIQFISNSWRDSCRAQITQNYDEYAELISPQIVLEATEAAHKEFFTVILQEISGEIEKSLELKEAEFAKIALETDTDELKQERRAELESLRRYKKDRSKQLVEEKAREMPSLITSKLQAKLDGTKELPKGSEFTNYMFALTFYVQKNSEGFELQYQQLNTLFGNLKAVLSDYDVDTNL